MNATQRPSYETGAQRWRAPGSSPQWQQEYGEERRNGGRSRVETWGALLGGSALAAFGISRRSWPGAALAAAGGWLIYRGVSGRQGLSPVQVRVSFTINKPVEEVWRFWRDFRNLPRFMSHLESVQPTSERYSYWTAHAPLGGKVCWHAEITDERENDYLVWRSLPGSDIENIGAVEFRPAPGERGTEIHVNLDYRPPAGHAGALVAKLFGEEPEQQVREDLRHLKQLLETGEIPTTEGQPHGRRSLKVKAVQQVWREPRPEEYRRTA